MRDELALPVPYLATVDRASLERMAEAYRAALDQLNIPYGPGQCAPAIGVHRGCDHDPRWQ